METVLEIAEMATMETVVETTEMATMATMDMEMEMVAGPLYLFYK